MCVWGAQCSCSDRSRVFHAALHTREGAGVYGGMISRRETLRTDRETETRVSAASRVCFPRIRPPVMTRRVFQTAPLCSVTRVTSTRSSTYIRICRFDCTCVCAAGTGFNGLLADTRDTLGRPLPHPNTFDESIRAHCDIPLELFHVIFQ